MTQGREVIAVLLLIVAFLITQFNPVSLNFSWTTVVGLLLVALFGALITVGGMIEVRWHYLLPIAALGLIDISALGLFLFAVLGVKAADREEENMIKPNILMINNATFSSYTFFVLAAVVAAYPLISFEIPDAVSSYAVEMLVPSIGCELEYTGQECVDILVNGAIDRQCSGSSACIIALNENRGQLEESILQELGASFPGFDLDRSIREILQDTLDVQIEVMTEPYEDIFKFVMAFVIFSVFQVMASPLTVVGTGICKVLLAVMERANLLTKETVKVEKLRFSA